MPDSCPSPCSILWPHKPVPMAGWAQRAACTPGRGLRIWQGKGEESLSMAERRHPAAWPGVPPLLSRTPKAWLGCQEQLQKTQRETQTPGGSTELQHCRVAQETPGSTAAPRNAASCPASREAVSRLAHGSSSQGVSIAHRGEAIPGRKLSPGAKTSPPTNPFT